MMRTGNSSIGIIRIVLFSLIIQTVHVQCIKMYDIAFNLKSMAQLDYLTSAELDIALMRMKNINKKNRNHHFQRKLCERYSCRYLLRFG